MDFLKQRLEEVIKEHKLEVGHLSNLLHSFSEKSSREAAQRVQKFRLQWESENYLQRIMFAYFSGSWTPQVANSPEIRSQKTYDDFLSQNYKLTMFLKSSPPSSIPYTVEEMLQHDFWRDLYNQCGQKVISFLLDKSLLIFQSEENVFVVVANQINQNCTLNQKFAKYSGILQKHWTNPIQKQQEHYASFNPYYFQRKKILPKLNLKKRKRIPSSCDEVKSHDENNKRPKISETNATTTTLIENHNEKINCKDEAKSAPGIIRWLKPTKNDLELLVKKRKETMEKAGRKSTVESEKPEINPNHLNFIGIMETAAFQKIAKNSRSIIIKQSANIGFKKKWQMFPQWKGLIIPEPKNKSDSSKHVVNVYFISEYFARNNNIRVKVKRRRRQRRDKIEIPHASQNQIPSTLFNKKHDDLNMEIYFERAYDPLMKLETLPALYNKISWSKWPRTHIMVQSMAIGLDEGSQLLLFNILLKTDVGYSHIDDKFIILVNSEENCPLRNVLKSLLTFHNRVKDLHKLVKQSLNHWMLKSLNKNNRKQRRIEMATEAKRSSETTINLSHQSILLLSSSMSDGNSNPILNTNPISQQQSFNDGNTSNITDSGKSVNVSIVSTLPSQQLTSSAPSQTTKQLLRATVYAKLKDKIPYNCIIMMFKHIFHLSGINKLLGSLRNQRNFFSFLRKSLILAGTKSALQLGQMMSQLNPNQCEWLSLIKDNTLKNCLFAKVMKWIFQDYVLTILRTSFYVTEMNSHRFNSCFYLREAWKSISESVRFRLLKERTLKYIEPVKKLTTTGTTANGRKIPLGITSTIRFLPKSDNGLRPIISLRKEARNQMDERNAKAVIDYIVRTRSPHRIRDMNLLRSQWSTFITEWEMNNKPTLYFVKVDIKDAYPSVKINKLKMIIDNLSSEIGNLCKTDWKVITRSRSVYRQTVCPSNEPPDLGNGSIYIRPCIVQKTNRENLHLDPKTVFQNLFPYTTANTVQIGKHKYNFEQGLPQGWNLSEGYCNLYYGEMDRKYLADFLNNKGDFFNTSVDDYLYITPKPHRAFRFLQRMEMGIVSYACRINFQKLSTNIYPRADLPTPSRECEFVNFVGWKFCLTCGHIARDFSRYAGQDMVASITFIPRNHTSPENFLISRMKVMLPARLQDFILDPLINCRDKIILNILEAGLIFAFRFHAICRVIYPNLNALKEESRAKSIVRAIIVCARSVSRLILRTNSIIYPLNPSPPKCQNRKKQSCTCQCVLSYIQPNKRKVFEESICDKENRAPTDAEIKFVMYHAFLLKLKRHDSVFRYEIIPRVHKLMSLQQTLIEERSLLSLKILVGKCMPLHFQDIKI